MELTRRHQLELAVLVALACLVTAIAFAYGYFTYAVGPRHIRLYVHDKGGSYSELPRDVSAVIGDGWEKTPTGLRLPPGPAGSITIRFSGNDQDTFLLFLEGTAASALPLTISVSSDGLAYSEAIRSSFAGHLRLDLTNLARSPAPVWLRLHLTHHATRPAQADPILSTIRLTRLKSSKDLWNIPLAGLLVLIPSLAYYTRLTAHRTGSLPFGLAVLCGLGALTATFPTRHPDVPRWLSVVTRDDGDVSLLVPYLLLMVLLGWHGRVWVPSAPLQRLWAGYALGGTILWASHLRLTALAQFGFSAPNADTIEYLDLAAAMTSPYDTQGREPFWPWLIYGWSWLAGYDTAAVRLFTVLLSSGLLMIAYRFFRDYTGHFLSGILVAVLLGTNPYLVELSTRGLRDEAFAIAVLCTVYFVFVRRTALSPAGQAVGLALSGTAVQLLRFNSYLFLIPLLLIWGWRQRASHPGHLLLPFAFITAMSAPHLLHNYLTTGDPLNSINAHASWARNQEFVVIKQTGCEGCPRAEELPHNKYAGAPVTAAQYLLEMHGMTELADVTGRGYLNLYLAPTELFATQTGTRSVVGYALYLAGLALMLCGPHRELIALIVLLGNITPFVVMMGIEARVMVHTAPLASFVMIYPIYWLLAGSCGVRRNAGVRSRLAPEEDHAAASAR